MIIIPATLRSFSRYNRNMVITVCKSPANPKDPDATIPISVITTSQILHGLRAESMSILLNRQHPMGVILLPSTSKAAVSLYFTFLSSLNIKIDLFVKNLPAKYSHLWNQESLTHTGFSTDIHKASSSRG
jgi:hypothetical protein